MRVIGFVVLRLVVAPTTAGTATGTASAAVYPNASVTVERVRSTMMSFSLTTVTALNPGDNITLISAPSEAIPTTNTSRPRNTE